MPRRDRNLGTIILSSKPLVVWGVAVCLGIVFSTGLSAKDPVIFRTGDAQVDERIPVTNYDDVSRQHPRRPQYHFTSKRNWINDPNGMVHDGERFHLFFQHNPLGVRRGNVTWGHATSKDMLHWRQKPHALLPYKTGERSGTIFSGTAIVDHMNSLGKQTGDIPTIVAFFTFASKKSDQPGDGFYQAMAYSTDRCQTWNLHNDGKPVIENQGLDAGERDPKVFWHGESERWVVCLWVQRNPGTLRFFTSENLTDWEFASDFQRGWAYESPDVFFAQVDGKGDVKTVVCDASGDYEIGHFDGTTFHSETPALRFGEGGDLYAGQVFNNHPQFRVIGMSRLRVGGELAKSGELPFQGQMTIPVQYRLTATENGPRLCAKPIREIQNLVVAEERFGPLELTDSAITQDFVATNQTDADIVLKPGAGSKVFWNVGGIELIYDASTFMLQMQDQGKSTALIKSMPPRDGEIKLRVMVDRLSVEVFAFDGLRYTAKFALPNRDPKPPSLRVEGGTAEVVDLVYRQIASTWE